MKRKPIDWEKIFANHISDKELVSKIGKKLLKLEREKKSNKQIKKKIQGIWIYISTWFYYHYFDLYSFLLFL